MKRWSWLSHNKSICQGVVYLKESEQSLLVMDVWGKCEDLSHFDKGHIVKARALSPSQRYWILTNNHKPAAARWTPGSAMFKGKEGHPFQSKTARRASVTQSQYIWMQMGHRNTWQSVQGVTLVCDFLELNPVRSAWCGSKVFYSTVYTDQA